MVLLVHLTLMVLQLTMVQVVLILNYKLMIIVHLVKCRLNILHTVGKTEMVEQQLQTMMVMFQLLYKQMLRYMSIGTYTGTGTTGRTLGMV